MMHICRRLVSALLVGGFLLCAQPASAAIAFVQSANNENNGGCGTTLSKAFTSNTTAGNFIAVATAFYGGTSVSSVSDTHNTYTSSGTAASFPSDGAWQIAIYYAKNIAGGAETITITYAASTTYCGMAILEFSGVHATAPTDVYDTTGTGAGSTTDWTTASFSSAVNDEVALAVSGNNNGGAGPYTAGSGYTLTDTYIGSRSSIEYKIASGALSGEVAHLTATNTVAQSWIMVAVTFRPAAGGGATSHPCSSRRLLGVGCE